jgi:hypothetical protein
MDRIKTGCGPAEQGPSSRRPLSFWLGNNGVGAGRPISSRKAALPAARALRVAPPEDCRRSSLPGYSPACPPPPPVKKQRRRSPGPPSVAPKDGAAGAGEQGRRGVAPGHRWPRLTGAIRQSKSGILLRGRFRLWRRVRGRVLDDDIFAVVVMPRMQELVMPVVTVCHDGLVRALPIVCPRLVGDGRHRLRGSNDACSRTMPRCSAR